MTVETELAALTAQTTALLDVFSQQKASVDGLITNAILASQNSSTGIIASLTASLINSQALIVGLVTKK
jgi:hypothetical protein